ncbi:MAG TPA: hypothetical protein VFD70_02445, partial [Anaerolineae bacterium]|nr:hypothetical protein [Anaerolineae bacterium]
DPQEQQDYLKRALATNPFDERARAAMRTVQPAPTPTASYAPPALPISTESNSPNAASSNNAGLGQTNNQPLTSNLQSPSDVLGRTNLQPPSPTPASEVAKLIAELEMATTDDEREQLYDRILALEPDNLQVREARTMLRVRRLRDSARQTTNDAAPSRRRRSASASDSAADQRLRTLFFILLALFVILAIAGIILITTQ